MLVWLDSTRATTRLWFTPALLLHVCLQSVHWRLRIYVRPVAAINIHSSLMLITLVSIKYDTSDVPWTALLRPPCGNLAVINIFRCTSGATQRQQKGPCPPRILGCADLTNERLGG